MTASPVTSGPKRESCDGRSHEWIIVEFNHTKPNADTYFCIGCGERRVMPSPYLPAQVFGAEPAYQIPEEERCPRCWSPLRLMPLHGSQVCVSCRTKLLSCCEGAPA